MTAELARDIAAAAIEAAEFDERNKHVAPRQQTAWEREVQENTEARRIMHREGWMLYLEGMKATHYAWAKSVCDETPSYKEQSILEIQELHRGHGPIITNEEIREKKGCAKYTDSALTRMIHALRSFATTAANAMTPSTARTSANG